MSPLEARRLHNRFPMDSHRSDYFQRLCQCWDPHKTISLLRLQLDRVGGLPLGLLAFSFFGIYQFQNGGISAEERSVFSVEIVTSG